MPKEQHINKNRSSISKASSYQEMGEFWDEHSLIDYWDATEPVEFEVSLESEDFYYKIELTLANKVYLSAQKKGMTSENLINSWIEEKLQEKMI